MTAVQLPQEGGSGSCYQMCYEDQQRLLVEDEGNSAWMVEVGGDEYLL